MGSPYDLIKVKVGPKSTTARPIAWDGNKNPIKYNTTCTGCNKLVQFNTTDIKDIRGEKVVECLRCGVAQAPENIKIEELIVDPIENKLMTMKGERIE